MQEGEFEIDPKVKADVVRVPSNFNYSEAVDQAQTLVENYGVVFVAKGKIIGSGTLIIAKGIKGILTAHHVAKVLYAKESTGFSLGIRFNMIHSLDVTVRQFDHIVVGDSDKNKFEHTGPDLSFLMITDDGLSARLGSIKSFFPLNAQIDISKYPPEQLREMPFFISGSPQEFSKDDGTYQGMKLTKFTHLQMQAFFKSIRKKNGFDYLRFEVASGDQDYPSHFGGVSGGGIWLAVGQRRDGKAEFHPVLQGVIFYQSSPYKKNTRRLLIGHGPSSIYGSLIQRI